MASAEIKEADKPFILALVSAGITVVDILVTAVGAFLGNEKMLNAGFELLKFTFPLTTMAWGFYFSKKE